MIKNPPLKKSYQKTLKVIKSSKSIIQLDSANRMVKNFKTLYKNVGYPKVLSYNLDRELNKKQVNILKNGNNRNNIRNSS